MEGVHRPTESDLWAVLVAGEHHSVSKTLGSHSSITSIGDAFNILRQHLPRERIIVIAQIEECRLWHDQPFEEKVKGVKDAESAERQRPMWAEKKVSFWKHLGQMIEEGGADYDGKDVNPDTILRVVLGIQSEKYPRVVNYKEGKTKLFLTLFGHGSWSGKNDNHYFYMPYPSEPVLHSLSETIRPIEVKLGSELNIDSDISIMNGNDTHEINPAVNNCNISTNDNYLSDPSIDIHEILTEMQDFNLGATVNINSDVENGTLSEVGSRLSTGAVSALEGLEVGAATDITSSLDHADTLALNIRQFESIAGTKSTAMTDTDTATADLTMSLFPHTSEHMAASTTNIDTPIRLPDAVELDSSEIYPSISGESQISQISVIIPNVIDRRDCPLDPMTDVSPLDLEVPTTPIICEGIVDPIYQCINSHLPLSGGTRKPFRVHIRYFLLSNNGFSFIFIFIFISTTGRYSILEGYNKYFLAPSTTYLLISISIIYL